MIHFNQPYFSGNELQYIEDAMINKKELAGNGYYSHLCQEFLQKKYGFKNCLLTTSCTGALEMCALLIETKPEDEIIVPSFTFVSTANAFATKGAKIIFADSVSDNPNLDVNEVEKLITSKTKAIVCVHYAGVACQMDELMSICKKNNLYLIEDAAQSIDSYYNGKPLGTFGDLATFSFHETKNIICGKGGLLVVNNKKFINQAEVTWENGTNKVSFSKGHVNKYKWHSFGSSFSLSDMNAAFLWAQLENLDDIQSKRIAIWKKYNAELKPLKEKSFLELPVIPKGAYNNAHMYYVVCRSTQERKELILYLNKLNIHPVFHYLPLHKSPFISSKKEKEMSLPNSEYFSDRLLRLPFYVELSKSMQEEVINGILNFYSI